MNLWPTERLGRLARLRVSNVDKKSAEGERAVRLCNYMDVYKNDRITGDLDFMAASATDSQVRQFGLRAGDTVFTKDSETADDIGVPAFVAADIESLVCGYHLAIATPDRAVVDARFLYWAMASATVRQQWTVLASGVTRMGLRSDEMTKVAVPVPPVDEQRRIADFLDTETARLDQLVAVREKQEALLADRWKAHVTSRVDAAGAQSISLRRLGTRVTTGPFGTVFEAGSYVSNGTPMVNPSHISDGRIVADEEHSVSDETARRLARHTLRTDDLVVARKGDLGRAARVGPEQDGWICGSDCIALHVSHSAMLPGFLDYLLRLPMTREQLQSRSYAATMPSLNEGNLLSLVVPTPPLSVQAGLIAEFDGTSSRVSDLRTAMTGQIRCLRERRQALITAAVTGQLDVTTASRATA